MSCHSRPTCGICRKWSITHRLVKPASSAAAAIAASVSAVAGRVAGEVEARDLQAEVERHGILLLAGGGRGGGEEGGRDERDRARRGGRRRTPRPRAPRRPPRPAASWAATTFAGHGRAARPVALAHHGGRRCRTGPRGRARRCARPSARQAARRLASSPVESTTVVSRRPSRLATIRSSTSKASRLARWSRSPLPTTARRRSEETTWSGWNQACAQCDLPAAVAPTSTTRQGSGSRSGSSPGGGGAVTPGRARRPRRSPRASRAARPRARRPRSGRLAASAPSTRTAAAPAPGTPCSSSRTRSRGGTQPPRRSPSSIRTAPSGVVAQRTARRACGP